MKRICKETVMMTMMMKIKNVDVHNVERNDVPVSNDFIHWTTTMFKYGI